MVEKIKDGILYFDGCNTIELAEKFGTPLYVMSETDIVSRFAELRECFLNRYNNTRVAYASKAFCNTALFKICEREGMCIDVVSGGELYTAIKSNFPAERIEFNGNNKLPEELEMAIDYGIGRIIIDGLQELDLIETICASKNKVVDVLFRVTPGVVVNTHDYITTGKKDSKFGIPLDEKIFYPYVKKAIDSKFINLKGLHFHVGSQLFDNTSHLQAVDIVLNCVKKIKEKYNYDLTELNLGGGFGVRYTSEIRKPASYFIEPMMEKIENFYKEIRVERPSIVIEPGRSIVAEAGISLYTIGSIKDVVGIRKYVSVDGGMTDNIRPALYQAKYRGIVANKAGEMRDELVTICGKCCESGDVLIKDVKIPKTAEAGDIFAVFSTGAYGYSMASNYNNNPIPAVVLVKNGKADLIVARQSYEDIISRNVIPERLK